MVFLAITEKLSEWYALAEEKFYKVFDWIELKGVPIYNYNDFLEKRGIPVFPFTIALVAIIAVLIAWILTISMSVAPTLALSIKDDNDNPMTSVNIVVLDEGGKKLFDEVKSHAGEIKLQSVPIGAKITIEATKTGYEKTRETITVKDAKTVVELELAKIVKPITGLLKVVDEKTGIPIEGALVTATWGKDSVRQVQTDKNGIAKLDGIPEGEKINITIKADNYEDSADILSFEELSTRTFQVPAKTSASFGTANLIITVFDKDTKNTLNDVRVDVFNVAKNEAITQGITKDGQVLVQLPKGTTVRVVATKSGYIRFDSTAGAQPLVIREDEESLDIFLEKGGQKIKVNAKQKDSLLSLIGATILLYNEAGEFLDSNKTGFAGSVEFSDLNSDVNYFVAGFLDGYIGDSKKINPGTTSEADLVLELATEQNTAPLNAYVYSASGDAADDAILEFFEIKDDGVYPTGVQSARTAYDGFATTKMPVGRNIFVTAKKDIEYGDANKIIVAQTENAVMIRMYRATTVKTLLVYTDENTLLEEGYATIETIAGNTLFDGNIEFGTIEFDAKNNKTANVTITTPDGNVFSEQISIPDGNTPIVLRLGKENNNQLAPQIKFLGIIDSEGKTIDTLSPGKEYWLKFETSWISGQYAAGIHVRIGSDEIKFADSEDVGIVGFSAAGADSFYGRTWNAFPAPGNEGIDFRNAGKAGAMNKWIELYYQSPQGIKIVKVKVRVREGATAQATMLHYRTWAIIGNAFERNPIDSELGKERFVETKTGLYAETIDTELQLFAAEASCEKDICVSYDFVAQNGEAISTKDFKAVKDRVFALEATIKSKKTVGGLLKASTQKEKPKLTFTGVEVESFTEFMDSNTSQSSMGVNDLSLVENAERRVRFYFKPKLTGNASIKTQLLAENTAVNDEFFFNIFEEKPMTATIVPETILIGKDFTVYVKEFDGNKGIEKAALQLKNDAGSIVASMVGDASANNGASGAYLFKNTFPAGNYTLEISAQTFTPLTMPVQIGTTDMLKLSETEITISIPKGEQNGTKDLQLSNESGFDVQNIEFEFDTPDSFPLEFEVSADIPEAMKKGAKARISVNAIYTGDINKTVNGTADLIIRGSVAGKFPTTTRARVIIEYNKTLDANCLEFDRKSLQIFLSGATNNDYYPTQYAYQNPASNQGTSTANTAGTSATYNPNTYNPAYGFEADQAEEQILVKNNCGIALEIEARAEARNKTKDLGVDVQVEGFSLEPNQSTTITVTATNKILRRFDVKENRNFDLVFTAKQLEKRLQLTVTLWDKKFAIAVRNSIVLWLAQGQKGEPVIASTPLFIRNIGEADIENLSIDIAEANWEGVSVRIAPPGSARGQILPKGANLLPARMVVAEVKGGTAKGKLVHGFLVIKGTIKGREYELRKIDVWVHVSALNCLKAYAVSDLDFESTLTGMGVIDKKISVRNTCEEAVRIVDVEPNRIGANSLVIVPLVSEVLEKDAEAEFILRLTKGYDYKADNVSIGVIGLTMLTHKFIGSDRVNARVALGERAVETGLASAEYNVNICNPDGTISKEKKKVRFPIISKTADCTKGYCDAELAAEYIGTKILQKIEQVRSAVDRGNADIANFPGCASISGAKACSFARMGVKSDVFDLYLSNDAVTDFLMKKTLSEKNPELKNYSVSYCSPRINPDGSIGDCDAESIAATGFPNLMYLSSGLRGCGKYRIKVDGAIFASGLKIEEKGYTIAVNVSSKQTTPECTNKITNAMNFLPQDATLTESSAYGAWPGIVEARTELEEAGKLTAKELFTKEERYSTNSGSNKLHMDTGELKTGIVKLEMLQAGMANEPKTINAIINKALGVEENKPISKDVAKEAANAIASLKTQRLEEGKSCVSADDSFMVIGSYGKLGAITIAGPSEIKMKQGKADTTDQAAMKAHSCIGMNVVSKISESVFLKTNADEIENKPFGISKVYLRQKTVSPQDSFTAIDEKTAKLLTKDLKTSEYKFDFQLCAVGNKEMVLAKKGIEIKVWAESSIDPLRKVDPPKIVKALPCATHPYDLINALDGKAPGTYYATVGWKGEPEKIRLSDIVNKMENDKAFNEAKANLGANIELGAAWQEKDKSNKLKSIWGYDNGVGYFTACSAATIAGDAATGVKILSGAVLADIVANCVIPAVWVSLPLWGSTGEGIKKWIEGAGGWVWDKISSIWGGGSKQAANAMQQQANDQLSKEQVENELFWSAMVSGGARDFWSAAKSRQYLTYLQKGWDSPLSLRNISGKIADDVIKQMQANIGDAATMGTAPAEWAKLQTSLRKNILDTLKTQAKAGGKMTEEALTEAVTGSVGKTFSDNKLPKALMDQIVAKRGGASATNYSAKLKAQLPSMKADAMEELFYGETLATAPKKIRFNVTNPTAVHDGLVNSLTNKYVTLFKINPATPKGLAAQNEIRGIITAEVDTVIPAVGTPLPPRAITPFEVAEFTEEQLKGLNKNIVNRVKTNSGNIYTGRYQAAVSSAEKNFGEQAFNAAKTDLKAGKGLTGAKIARFGFNLLRGGVITYLSNLAGLYAFDKTRTDLAPDLGAVRKFGTPDWMKTGGAKTLDDIDPWIENGETYKITKDADGRIWPEKVKDLSSIPEKANWIDPDCKGEWAEKPMGNPNDYSPTVEKIGVVFGKELGTKITAAYLAPNGYSAKVKSAAVAASVPQDMLLAALTADAMARYANIAPNACGRWLDASSKEEGEKAIGCIATELKKGYNASDVQGTFNSYFKALPDNQKKTGSDNALRAYQLWQSMKTTAQQLKSKLPSEEKPKTTEEKPKAPAK